MKTEQTTLYHEQLNILGSTFVLLFFSLSISHKCSSNSLQVTAEDFLILYIKYSPGTHLAKYNLTCLCIKRLHIEPIISPHKPVNLNGNWFVEHQMVKQILLFCFRDETTVVRYQRHSFPRHVGWWHSLVPISTERKKVLWLFPIWRNEYNFGLHLEGSSVFEIYHHSDGAPAELWLTHEEQVII